MNGLTSAYLGDAYYELEIRKHLIKNKGFRHVNKLHNYAIKYTSGSAQANIIDHWLEVEELNETEISYFKKGRNSSSSGRKNIDARTYNYATGFESLLGYLYVNDKKRLDELILKAIEFVEKGDKKDGKRRTG